jgi:DNA polymerase elongation subunit (family B)
MALDVVKKELGRECRFVVHIPTRQADKTDLHLIKEVIHFEDGSTKPNLRYITDFKRPFWVTKKPYRNHQQKKEYEHTDKLLRFETTQSNLRHSVAKALDKAWSSSELQQLSESPYLYGSDVPSSSIIKYDYRKRFPDLVSPFTVSFFDIETDVVHGTNDPILATLIFGKTIYTFCLASFIEGYSNPTYQLDQAVKKYLQTYVDKHQYEIEFTVCLTPVDLIKGVFAKAHELVPDFLAIWNIDFDIPRIIETLEKYGVDPKEVFSDPKLPAEFKFCRYKKGSTKKITASGQVKPKNPSEQWHTLICPAGFYVIDAMCSFRFVRQGEQERPEYKLDSILNEELGLRKLSFEEAEGYVGLEWHEFMQTKYPFEYIVYNMFDCIGMVELEEKNNDLQSSVPVNSDVSDFMFFDKQTKRFADSYHFFLLERGKVIGTVPPRAKVVEEVDDEISEDDDDEDTESGEERYVEKNEIMSLRGWIN